MEIDGFPFAVLLPKPIQAISAQVDVDAETIIVLIRTGIFERIGGVHIVEQRIAMIGN